MTVEVPRLGRDEIVARYVGGAHVDLNTGQINGSAFDRTPKDIDGLSFTRRNILDDDCDADRAAIRQAVGSRLRFGRTAVFAELPVGIAAEALEPFDGEFFFVEDPLEAQGLALANLAHALLIGLPFRGEQVGSLKSEIAGDRLRVCIVDRFAAIE